MVRDRAKNELRQALKVKLRSGNRVFNDSLDKTDRDDLYRVKLTNRSQFELTLSDVKRKAKVKIELFAQSSRRRQMLKELGNSEFSDLRQQRISKHLDRLFKFNSSKRQPTRSRATTLEKGIYYVRAYGKRGATDYTLTFAADSLPSNTPTPGKPPVPSPGGGGQPIPNPNPGWIKVNFQPNDAPVPQGYIKDTGAAFNAVRGYGWVRQNSLANDETVPIDISGNARDRNREDVEQRLDTFIHMQYPADSNNSSAVKTPAAWEYELPNGRYSVFVSAGDGATDSRHKINIEGVTAISPFQPTNLHEYELGAAVVDVLDGRLTVDAIGGTNTKINYLEIKPIPIGDHPSVTGGVPTSRATNVSLNAAVTLDVNLISVGGGVDANTLTTANVQLIRTQDNTVIPGVINTTGGGDAIVYQPSAPLDPQTHYTFRVTDGVKDQFGNPFLPFSSTFSTGNRTIPPIEGVKFQTPKTVFSSAPISSLTVSPDGNMLYATALDGQIRRWTISANGDLVNPQTFSGLAGANPNAPRALIGLAFDPTNPNVLWISHNDTLFEQPANDFTGKISKLTLQPGADFNAVVQDYVVGLPRSAKDHLTNSIAFGPDGNLYVTQGSNSAMGAPDNAWGQRPERLLTGAVLSIDPTLAPPAGGFNVQTETYTNASGVTTVGTYNPFEIGAPVQIYATGVRNAYDLVWHSNGSLYTPTNGSAAGGNTPDNPTTDANEGLQGVATQNDYLFKVTPGGYYGHPNPLRGEYIMNGGNPTAGDDAAEIVQVKAGNKTFPGYAVGTQPDPDYKGFAYDFGRNRSPNGVIEYQSNAFGGALRNKLLVTEYSGGDDILGLTLDNNGNIVGASPVITGLTNPLDLAEDRQTGNLYIAELVNELTGEGRIRLFKTPSTSNNPRGRSLFS